MKSNGVPSAAARLARLPVVRTACGKLWLLYADAKRSHPNLRTVCEALEESVAALGTVASVGVSPVLVQLEPHSEFRPPVSTANDVACKSLDWLEATFPVLHTPTEQVNISLPLLKPHSSSERDRDHCGSL
uniref:Uncharacterized protein n=1 Tax=Scophthalmus maximus TaxID=52904 RepID=A0A8D3A955_SCOMX